MATAGHLMRDDIGHLPTILVVEDNEHDIELLGHRFQEARLMNPVRVVRDGVAAAEYLEATANTPIARLTRFPALWCSI